MLMQKLRDSTKTVIIIVIAAFVGTIFFDWGMDVSRTMGRKGSVGTINGRDIPFQEFKTAMDRSYQEMQRNPQNQSMDAENMHRNARTQTWERFVSQELLDKVLEEYQLGASEGQLYHYLRGNPPPEFRNLEYFQNEDSVFDTTKYYEFLNTPQVFSDPGMRALEQQASAYIIPVQSLEAVLQSVALVNDLEASREAEEMLTRARFEYLRIAIPSVAFDSTTISDSDIAKHYEAETDSFQTKGQAEVDYVRLDREPSARDENRIKQDLTDMKEDIESGKLEFEELARDESEDEGSAARDGDLGWFGHGMMVKEFEETAYAMEKGQLSEPVRSQFGWHLIRLDDRRKTDGQEEIKARHILIKVSPSLETLDSLRELADSLQRATQTTGDLALSAQKMGVSVKQSGRFERGTPVAGIGSLPGLNYFAFHNEVGALGEVMENDEAIYVCQLKNLVPAGRLPLKECRKTIVGILARRKRTEIAKMGLSQAVKKAGTGAQFPEIAESEPMITYGVSDTITRNGYVPEIGAVNPIIYKASSQKPGEISPPLVEDDAVVVVRTLYVKAPEKDELNQQLATAHNQLAMRKKYQVYNQWYMNQKKNADIVEDLSDFFEY